MDPTLTSSRDDAIRRALRALRDHLLLDIAFVSEFIDNQRVFRFVDSGTASSVVEVGASDPLEESYCHYVATEQVPQFLRDPATHPIAAELPATATLPVGTHLSIPIRFSDGRIYGTLCAFSREVRPDLDPSDIRGVRMMAELVGEYLEDLDRNQEEMRSRRAAVQSILNDPNGLAMVFQPLVDIRTGVPVAVEALARFRSGGSGPASVFHEAFEVGLGVELEVRAVEEALQSFDAIPAPLRLSVNVSPETLTTKTFARMITRVPPNRLIVEVTEHAAIKDADEVRAVQQRLAASGVVTAIDDVGAGFSGLSRILETGATELKIDRSIVRDVDRDPVKQAMIGALVGFCHRTGFDLVAEGIETEGELLGLRLLGIKLGQGYYFAKPGPLELAVPQVQRTPRRTRASSEEAPPRPHVSARSRV